MANESITTNFVGTQAAGYISRSTLAAKSIAGGYVNVRPNVSVPTAIGELEASDDMLQPYNSTFHAQGGYVKSQRMINPTLLMVNLAWDKKALLKDWEALQMNPGALGKTAPADFTAYLMSRVEDSVSRQIEANLWQGVKDPGAGRLQQFDGLLKQASGAIVPNAAVGHAFTQANIQAAFGAAYAATPETVSEQEDYKFYVSPKTAKIYKTSLENYLNLQSTGARPTDYHGIEIVSTPGLQGVEDTIIAARTGNLWFATDLLSDAQEVRIIDMLETTGDQNIRVRMELFAATQVGFPGEIVIYKNA